MTVIQDRPESASQPLEETVTQLVTSTLRKKPKNIDPDTPLFSSQAAFDSFALMELVLQLEQTFDLSIPDDHLDPETFHSIKAISEYVHTRLAQGD